MNTEERRSNNRCPVCQGPMKEDRCRNSLCPHNHRTVTCPRCTSESVDAIEPSGSGYSYSCRDCQHRWKG